MPKGKSNMRIFTDLAKMRAGSGTYQLQIVCESTSVYTICNGGFMQKRCNSRASASQLIKFGLGVL